MASKSVSPDIAEAIRYRKAQYTRFADTNQWHLLTSIMLPDMKSEFVDADGAIIKTDDGKTPYSFNTFDEFSAFFSSNLKDMQVIHVTGPGEIATTNVEDEVSAIFSVTYEAATKGIGGGVHGSGGGHYYETWKREGENWRIKDLRFVRLFWRVTVA